MKQNRVISSWVKRNVGENIGVDSNNSFGSLFQLQKYLHNQHTRKIGEQTKKLFFFWSKIKTAGKKFIFCEKCMYLFWSSCRTR